MQPLKKEWVGEDLSLCSSLSLLLAALNGHSYTREWSVWFRASAYHSCMLFPGLAREGGRAGGMFSHQLRFLHWPKDQRIWRNEGKLLCTWSSKKHAWQCIAPFIRILIDTPRLLLSLAFHPSLYTPHPTKKKELITFQHSFQKLIKTNDPQILIWILQKILIVFETSSADKL